MRISAALPTALLAGAFALAPLRLVAQPLPSPDVDRAEAASRALGAVLAAESHQEVDQPPTCVAADTAEPLASERARKPLEREAQAVADAAGRAAAAAGLDAVTSRWMSPPGSPEWNAGRAGSVDAALARRLDAQLEAALRGPSPYLLRTIDPRLIPAPLHAEHALADCRILRLSSPALSENVAFVEIARNSGDLRGEGGLYALEWRDGRWAVLAYAGTWTS